MKKRLKTGIGYLGQELEKGNPILVGVRHTYKKVKKIKGYKHEQNHDKSTDHLLLLSDVVMKMVKGFLDFMK